MRGQDELVYDPRTKMKIKDRIYSHLYDPVHKAFQKRLDGIIQSNSDCHGNQQRHMVYRGEEYAMTDPGPKHRPVNQCHPDMRILMKEYVQDLHNLNTHEVPYVLGFINNVLNSSNSLQDYLKVLPESVHRPVHDLMENCGCRTEYLQPDAIERLTRKHDQTIDLMKQRMAKNLIL